MQYCRRIVSVCMCEISKWVLHVGVVIEDMECTEMLKAYELMVWQ